ncbi:hypothetical protein ZEAMMB73_Zm00001d044755 [Zea mays]|uniref:Uncharacterized protein n=1 Tax=Zea mays TaxID=4577 RepID=A0A1D6NR94_MAIZE|nr:hypothetical protein ZEAMMB73_Zm00001d044755 [Zea mays]
MWTSRRCNRSNLETRSA